MVKYLNSCTFNCCRSKGGHDQKLYGFEFKFYGNIIPEVGRRTCEEDLIS